jgi:hypothetical protein
LFENIKKGRNIINNNKKIKWSVKKVVSPKPVREISLVVGKNFARVKILEKLKNEIISKIPFEGMLKNKKVVYI